MSKSESLFIKLATVIDSHITEGRRHSKERAIEHPLPERKKFAWLPTPGNVLFTLAVIVALLWAQSAGAIPFAAQSTASTGSIAYQGRLASAGGTPLTQIIGMEFRLYNAATGGAPLWTEQWTGPNSVQVSDGLFNVMLGSLTSIPQSVIAGNSNLFLGITVGTDDEMSPRVQLGSVPFAVQALTVPDGSITKAKLAADVSLVPPDGSITTQKLAEGAATGLWYAIGASNTSTTSNSWTPIPDMTLNITTTGKPILIEFETGFRATSSDAGFIGFGIFMDGKLVNSHAQRVDRGGESTSIQLSWIEVLPAGSHEVQIRWFVSGSFSAMIDHATNSWEKRVLVVREIRR